MSTYAVPLSGDHGVPGDRMTNALEADTTRFIRLGWLLVVCGFGGFVLWASLAPLDKGVPMSGTVTVETSKKAVQHETGGTVEAILVKEGEPEADDTAEQGGGQN